MKHFAAALALLLPLTVYAGFNEGVQAYERGDYAKAIAEFKPLAERGNAKAQYSMGYLYHYGYGVSRDETQAVKWFRLAADQGDALSQYYLGLIYENGKDVGRDLVAAHMWFSLSASNAPGYRDKLDAKQKAAELEHRMSKEQISQAAQMAQNWKPEK